MSDYHAELERHLREAARRQARRLPRLRAGVVLAVAASAAVMVVALVVALGAVGGEAEREVAAPPPGTSENRDCANLAVRVGETLPTELRDAFSVLTEPDTAPEDREVRELAYEAALQDIPGERPPRVFPEHVRRALVHGGRSFWIVPLCDEQERVFTCLVLVGQRLPGIPACGTVEKVREGKVSIAGNVDGDRWFHAVLLADGDQAAIHLGDKGIRGGTVDNVLYVEYTATEEEHEHARVVIDTAGDRTGCGEPVATQDPAPATIVDRIAVLRQEPDPPTDFELDHPDVRTIYAGSTRTAKFGSGEEAFVIPVMLGKCVNPQPGVCLVPMNRGFETACGQLTGGAGDPFVVHANTEQARETDVIGVTGDSVRAVDVIYLRADGSMASLRVEVEAGKFSATVAEAQGEVSVKPAG